MPIRFTWYVRAQRTGKATSCSLRVCHHFYDKAPDADEVAKFVSFKAFVNHSISGGFNYEKDPVRLKDAIANARRLFNRTEGGLVDLYSTEVYLLAQEIDGFVSEELEKLYNKLR